MPFLLDGMGFGEELSLHITLRARIFNHSHAGAKFFRGSIQAMLELQINGRPQQIPPDSNVAHLIASLHLEGKRYAIELNGEIVPKSRHAETRLSNGDKLEVVIAVGGG